jgi:hypothetical protein
VARPRGVLRQPERVAVVTRTVTPPPKLCWRCGAPGEHPFAIRGTLEALPSGEVVEVSYETEDMRQIRVVDRGIPTITPKKKWTTKGYRYRDIPVSKNTAKAALAFVKTRDTVLLDDKSVWNEIQRVRAATKLPKFSIHDLRRAWASAVHANGASIKQVSVWLGHSTIEVTERYIRVFQTDSTGHEFLPR